MRTQEKQLRNATDLQWRDNNATDLQWDEETTMLLIWNEETKMPLRNATDLHWGDSGSYHKKTKDLLLLLPLIKTNKRCTLRCTLFMWDYHIVNHIVNRYQEEKSTVQVYHIVNRCLMNTSLQNEVSIVLTRDVHYLCKSTILWTDIKSKSLLCKSTILWTGV